MLRKNLVDIETHIIHNKIQKLIY